MITTTSTPNIVTSNPDFENNTLIKEDLEGNIKKNTSSTTNCNGGKVQILGT